MDSNTKTLEKLRVSLTKHGASKVAKLLVKYPPNVVLEHVHDPSLDIDIDIAQAQSNLNYYRGVAPQYWDDIRAGGPQLVRSCVLLAIIFSHAQLIAAMQSSQARWGNGVIRRSEWSGSKAFTNFAFIFKDLGFLKKETKDYVEYDMSPIFADTRMPSFYTSIVSDKLRSIGLDPTDFPTLSLELGFNLVFGLDEGEYLSWLAAARFSPTSQDRLPSPTTPAISRPAKPFTFQPGHIPRTVSDFKMRHSTRIVTFTRLHNQIQNDLYTHLIAKHGHKNVGTEQPTDTDTRIDLVLRHDSALAFYEIKTSANIRVCIREALPQLLEYAYWPDTTRAQRLIVVSQHPLSSEARAYIRRLRRSHSIPLFYQSYALRSRKFSAIWPAS